MHLTRRVRATISGSLDRLIDDAFPALMQKRLQRRWSQAGFDRYYSGKNDPFNIEGESSPYAQVTFAHIMELLDRRYGHGLEVGCSEGSFTELLSTRCDHLLAIDITEIAVSRAQKRLTGKPWVRVERRTIPEEVPQGPFDLVVCAEVLYYLSTDKAREALRQLASRIQPGGTFLALHSQATRGVIFGHEVNQILPEVFEEFKEFRLTFSERQTRIGPKGAGYQLVRYDRSAT